jgi:hypothetical protein
MINKIDFGNNVGYKINDYAIKKKILDYLLNSVEIYNFEYEQISNEKQLISLRNEKYYVSPNIEGIEYIFLSKKINNMYYSVIIDKNSIGNVKNINYNDVIMISLKIRLCEKTYNGTIFDGKIVNLGGCSVFLINDGYRLYGSDIIEVNVNSKYDQINSFLDQSYIIDNNMNVIDFRLNKLNKISEIKDLVYNRMKKSTYTFDSIIFIPESKNKKYIYNLSNNNDVNFERILKGKRIDIDVVELFCVDEDNTDRRIGIAHIPNKKCSKICSENINNNDFSIIKCKLNKNFKKWEPIEIFLEDKIEISKYEDIKNIMMNVVVKEKLL